MSDRGVRKLFTSGPLLGIAGLAILIIVVLVAMARVHAQATTNNSTPSIADTWQSDTTIEKAMQLVKGGFSYRLKKEHGFQGEVWQRGFSEVRVNDRQTLLQYRAYIEQNPVKAGLVDSPQQYPYSYTYLAGKKAQGLKPNSV